MASFYVRSGAAGTGTGADWTNAFTTLAAALTASAAGDTIYLSDDHAESTAGTTLTAKTGATTNILCVNHAGSVPPVSADLRTTGAVSTTGNTSITIAGNAFCYGVIFTAGNSTGSPGINIQTSGAWWHWKNSSLRIGSSGSGGRINIGSSAQSLAILENTTASFGHAGQCFAVDGTLIWFDTASALLGTIPTTCVFNFPGVRGGGIECRGVDLSAATGTLVLASTNSIATNARFLDCKFSASVTKSSTISQAGGFVLECVRCDNGATNYAYNRTDYCGTVDHETTVVLTGGASDGTTGLALKMTTNANACEALPLESQPIAIWNDTVGSSVTATLQGIWGGASVPNNNDIWAAVEYLGSSGSPQASFANCGKADPLASAAGLSAGSGTWGGSTTKFALAVTFTPQQKGWIFMRMKAAKPSSTFYIDPKITLS